MNKIKLLILTFVVSLLFLVGFPTHAFAADDCAALGGAIVSSECQISTAVNKSGTFNLDETLHILPAGKIIVPPITDGNNLTLNITGDLIMDNGSQIIGDNSTANAKASTIVISATGTVTVANGASITANKTTNSGAGSITINAKFVVIDGIVESAVLAGQTGQSPHQPKDGGPISIDAACDLSVGNTGIISSRGGDAGADLVHLEAGCNLNIFGKVESTGTGHAVPDSPVNLCANANRPDKPTNSTGCVEVWAGDNLIIDSTNGNKGEINADIGITGGSSGRGWIDVFARGDITIKDGTDNDHTYSFGGGCTFNSTFAVHANGGLCQNTDDGGLITVKSRDGNVKLTGNAIQANSTTAGGKGGTITVEAKLDVDLDPDGILQAMGSSGGAPAAQGGHIIIKSYQNDIEATSTSNLNVIGKTIANPDGTVSLNACGNIEFLPGTITPSNLPLANIVKTTGTCGGSPTFQAYVHLPDCVCQEGPPGACESKVCSGNTIVVDENVTVDFNPATPTCTGNAALCADFTFDKSGATPDTWKAIFNLGSDKLLVKSGVTITTTQVPNSSNNRKAPGIVINTTCDVEVENGGHIVVESLNQQAGDILIHADGDVVVNGEIRDEVKGTNGLPGKITIETTCGNYTQSSTGLVEVLGVDPGGNDINIFTHDQGNILIDGLVLSRARAHVLPLNLHRPNINVAAFDGTVTINANSAEPLYDEYNFGGTKYDLWGGLLSWVTTNVNPGSVKVQASGNITVNGHGTDPTAPVRKSFGAIAAIATASNAPGGLVDVRSIGGSIIGNDRAFDVSGRNRLLTNFAHINLAASGNVEVSRLGGASFNPVVDASSPTIGDKGGKNDIRSFNGGIVNNLVSLISAAVPLGSGSVQGTNNLTSCTGVSNIGIANVNPTTVPVTACLGAPTPLFP